MTVCSANSARKKNRSIMAVKQRELLEDDSKGGVDIAMVVQYLQLFQPGSYLPTTNELVRCCKEIVLSLVKTPVPVDDALQESFVEQLNQVQELIAGILAEVSPKIRQEIVYSILHQLYPIITDPITAPCQPACVVLNVLQGEAAEWMVQEGDSAGPVGTSSLKAMVACMFRWLYTYDCSPAYSNVVMSFITQLELKHRWDVLVEVSLDYMPHLFSALINPRTISENVAPVLFHILGSMRLHPNTLDKIAPKIYFILESLAADSSQLSRQLLQNVVDITSALIDQLDHANRAKYADIVSTLDAHMTSNTRQFLQVTPWKEVSASGSGSQVRHKNGLRNQGNMCYFNSVMQALLLNKTFSRHAILNMNKVPLWSTVSKLFTRMMFSVGPSLDVTEFYKTLKPREFTDGHQHDCSEFLMRLLDELSARELQVMTKEPEPLQDSGGEGTSSSETSSVPVDEDRVEVIQSTSTGGHKRSAGDSPDSGVPKKKCIRHPVDASTSSFIQTTFGGVSVTNTTCLRCRSSSSQYDTFREIQLAIPEKKDLVNDEYSVQHLLNHYCQMEILTGDNAYHCNECNELNDAEKAIHLKMIPKYLVIVLKRFYYNPELQTHTKLMHKVSLDMVLGVPLVGTAPDIATYSLYATVIHAGTHIDMGHYYTLAVDEDQWYRFNDDTVEQVSENELMRLNHATETPYLLFYRREDVVEAPKPEFSELPMRLVDSVRAYDKQHASRHHHATRSTTGHGVRPVYT